jgi:hypothetical protein
VSVEDHRIHPGRVDCEADQQHEPPRRGVGGELLGDALSRARAAADVVAARLVVVDAISAQAAAFYEHHGFTQIPDNPNRLVQKMSDIAAAIDDLPR